MVRRLLPTDPAPALDADPGTGTAPESGADWDGVGRLTFVPFLPDGSVALRPDGRLPTGEVHDGEHPIDACLRIPLAQASYRLQFVHRFAADDGHRWCWTTGDLAPDVGTTRTGPPVDGDERRIVDEARADRAALRDEVWFRENIRTLQWAYLRAETPQGQSGFSRDAATWRLRRQQIADAIDGDGTFLDVGCANGDLAECVAEWCAERGIVVEPYGVDLSAELVDLARRRLPHWADRFAVGNAIDWVDPTGRRFDAVHVLIDAVPEHRRRELVDHHLRTTVAPGGRLLVSDHSARPDPRIDAVLGEMGFHAGGWCPGHDPERPSSGTAWITVG